MPKASPPGVSGVPRSRIYGANHTTVVKNSIDGGTYGILPFLILQMSFVYNESEKIGIKKYPLLKSDRMAI